MNKLARAVTKWTRTRDRRLARLISLIHNTSDFRQYCHVVNTAELCRLGLFEDSDFFCRRPLETQNRPLRKSNVRTGQFGCARSRRQSHTVRQCPKSYLWTLVCVWTASQLLFFAIEQTAVVKQLRCTREPIGVCCGKTCQLIHQFAHLQGRLKWSELVRSKNPIRINLVRSCAVPPGWASSFHDKLDHCRIVFKQIKLCQLRTDYE